MSSIKVIQQKVAKELIQLVENGKVAEHVSFRSEPLSLQQSKNHLSGTDLTDLDWLMRLLKARVAFLTLELSGKLFLAHSNGAPLFQTWMNENVT